MVTYQVGTRHFNNIYLALHHCWKTGGELKFYCYNYEFDQHNWATEPAQSIDLLMATHAKNLREKYQRLILLWSGGTDSHTIYNVFKHNNIHLDEIIIKADTTEGSMFPETNHIWLQNNHWDPTTILTRYDDYDTSLRLLDLPDEDWVWRNKGDLLKYGMTSTGDGVKFLCDRNHSGHNYKAIGGFEKPRLVHRKGQWFHRQSALVLQPTMGHDYIEHFFLEPLIAIKQAHMVKRAVKKLVQHTGDLLYDNDWAEAKWPKTSAGYKGWADACGRHDEVNLGISHYQKTVNETFSKTEINLTGDWKNLKSSAEVRLQHDLAEGNQAAVNYIKGFHNLTSEFGFSNYLIDNGWLKNSQACFTQLNFLWSKEYNLGA
jgi:hypothetical protein